MIGNFFTNIKFAYYEISNWFFVKGIIRKHSKTNDWQKFNLRSDWVGRIYTVINPQSPGDDGDTDEVLRIKYAERLKPLNLYLDSLGLGLSVTPAYEKIEGSNSYLFVYSPIFRVVTTWRVILFFLFWTVFFATPLDSLTWKLILKLSNLFANL